MKKILLFLFIGMVFLSGFSFTTNHVSAAGPFVTSIWQDAPCAGTSASGKPVPKGECGFCDAIIVAKNIIQLLFQFAFPITVGMIVWGAIMMVIAGGDTKKLTDSKSIMTSAALGLAVTLGSWLIVNAFLNLLAGSSPIPWSTISC